jgi:serine/threonine protein kinase
VPDRAAVLGTVASVSGGPRLDGDQPIEARVSVNHPHVCSLYDVGPDYLVMEYVEGESLHGPVPLAQALALAEQILDALDVRLGHRGARATESVRIIER